MEKIQAALDKARVQREAMGSAARPTARITPPAPPDIAPPQPPELGVPGHHTATVSPRLLARRRIVAASGGRATDAFRMLRTQVLGRLEQMGGGALAINSPKQGDGKTLVAVNLAVSIARHLHRRALLVDLDFRRPGIAKLLGIAPAANLSDHLQDGVPLADCLVELGIERLTALPQGRSVEHSSELLASPRMAALATELARDPDRIVIYDCPPLLATDDALIALGFATGCLLVLREGRTTRSELLRAAELVGEERLLGTVLNGAVWSFASGYETHVYYGNA
jgi:Mrp family chromosome partitioning ATPase